MICSRIWSVISLDYAISAFEEGMSCSSPPVVVLGNDQRLRRVYRVKRSMTVAKLTPRSGDVLLMVGTVKGGFLFLSDPARLNFTMSGPHFPGQSVWSAALLGLYYSNDEGESWRVMAEFLPPILCVMTRCWSNMRVHIPSALRKMEQRP